MSNLSNDRSELMNRLFAIENNWHDILYIHTPFCVQKCYYCVYSSKEPSDPGELDRFYNGVLPQQIELYRPALEVSTFEQVYFGGGTPSIGSPSQLEKTFERIPGFRDIPVKLTETSPFTVTEEHLELYSRYGFTFVSMGVQTLDVELLNRQNRRISDKETLIRCCDLLEKYNIISNIDLIFYLDTGGLEDLNYSRRDLDIIMSEIRPASITIHSSYMEKKSLEKQGAMIGLIKEMLVKYPEYRCTNALLEESELEEDMTYAAEYRLMRKAFDFHYYMTPKIPESHRYGHNMIALGAYEKFKPRYNYYYIFDYMDKYSFKALLKKYRFIYDNFINTRDRLHLPSNNYKVPDNFFKDEAGEEEFKRIIKEARLPLFQWNLS